MKSNCCQADVMVNFETDIFDGGPDGLGTRYYVCTKCKKACDRVEELDK